MKTGPEHNPDDALLDAVLGDEAWTMQSLDAKKAGMAALRQTRRRRMAMRFAQAAVIALLAAGVIWMPSAHEKDSPSAINTASLTGQSQSSPAATHPVQVANVEAIPVNPSPGNPTQSVQTHYISEDDMLALFPKGSCTVAVVNGRKELIFFDTTIESNGAPYKPGS